MKFLLLIFIFFNCGPIYPQNTITINGKIEMLSPARKIVLSAGGGNFKAEIKIDGTFLIQGELTESGLGLIKTDSSVSDAIWLEPGNYNIVCKEITLERSKAFYFRIPELRGPIDAELFHGFNEPQYYMPGNNGDERTKNRKEFDIKYIDSLFANHPDCKALPEILRFSRGIIGDNITMAYMSYLNKEQKTEMILTGSKFILKEKRRLIRRNIFRIFK